jgi:hypothetical protein
MGPVTRLAERCDKKPKEGFLHTVTVLQGQLTYRDLVSTNYSDVRYFNSIPGVFVDSPVPESVESHLMYREGSMAFVRNRNVRIYRWTKNG